MSRAKLVRAFYSPLEQPISERVFEIAVVTGGGSGIGTMIAAAYVQNGSKVYIAARKEKQLKDVRPL